ncbi:MAG: hypothetical protein V1906_01400 [Candidatus Woesearchaeota archaeon]
MQKISPEDYLRIRKAIVRKLYVKRAFRKGHMLLERLQSGIPSHLAGYVPLVVDDLIKEGIVIHYGRTKHGDAYQLNISQLDEIEDIVG